MESFCPFLTSPGMATFSTAAEAIKFPSVAQPISYTSSKWSPRIYDRPIPCIQLSLVLVLKSNLLWLLVIIHLPQQTDSTLSPDAKISPFGEERMTLTALVWGPGADKKFNNSIRSFFYLPDPNSDVHTCRLQSVGPPGCAVLDAQAGHGLLLVLGYFTNNDSHPPESWRKKKKILGHRSFPKDRKAAGMHLSFYLLKINPRLLNLKRIWVHFYYIFANLIYISTLFSLSQFNGALLEINFTNTIGR